MTTEMITSTLTLEQLGIKELAKGETYLIVNVPCFVIPTELNDEIISLMKSHNIKKAVMASLLKEWLEIKYVDWLNNDDSREVKNLLNAVYKGSEKGSDIIFAVIKKNRVISLGVQ